MINFLLGAPGGGKSYEAVVYHILPALAAGRKVITNLPLNLDNISRLDYTYRDLIEIRTQTLAVKPETDWEKAESLYKRFGIAAKNSYFNPAAFSHLEDYGDPWRHPETGSGPLYVIDECHLAVRKVGTPIEVEEWYSLHRHESADVLLITQTYGKVNQAIRELAQVVYRVRKATAFGTNDKYIRKVQDGLRGEVINESIRSYKPAYFDLYKSHTKGGGSELSAKDIVPIWRHWSFMGAGALFVVFFGMLFSGLISNPLKPAALERLPQVENRTEKFDVTPPVRRSEVIATKTVEVPEPIELPPEEIEPFDGMGIHVAGYVSMGDRETYLIALSTNGQVIQTFPHEQLLKAGYSVQPVSECVLRLGWLSHIRYVRCDTPQQTATPYARDRSTGGDPALRGGHPSNDQRDS